jgi:hypothetical protein
MININDLCINKQTKEDYRIVYANEFTQEIEANLNKTCNILNQVLMWFSIRFPDFKIIVNSGWRPVQYCKDYNARNKQKLSTTSLHTKGLAVDFADPNQLMSKFLYEDYQQKKDYVKLPKPEDKDKPVICLFNDLRLEHFSKTPTWCHLDVGYNFDPKYKVKVFPREFN